MDTNRIGQFLGLSPKLANPIDSAPQKGGFADLLFDVMSNRIGTTRPDSAGPLARVSTILPLGDDAATPATSRRTLSNSAPLHPADAPRDRHAAAGRRNADGETTAISRRDAAKSDTSAAAAPVAAKAAGCTRACDGKTDANEEIGGTAPTAEGPEIGDDTQDEVELQADAEGGDAQDSGTDQKPPSQEDTEQSPDPQAQATVIDPQAAITDTPDPLAATALPGSAGIAAASAAEDAVAPVLPGKDAQPDQKQSAATIPTPAASAGQALPAGAEEAILESTAEQTGGGQAGGEQTGGEQTTASGDPAEVAIAAALIDAPLSGEAEAAAQAVAIARQSERRAEDDGTGLFRRATQAARQGTSATGSGTANASSQPAASATNAAASATPGAVASAGTPASTLLPPLTPLGFDTGLGGTPGLPGWSLNLAQGAAASRPDFVANLRQHLQNLPANEQLALGIQRTARDGGGRITLQLSPSELGRIHVRLEIDDEKNVRASVSVERPGTLELLQRDTKALERALQDAGLKMDQGDLSFSLQGDDGESFAQEFGSGSDDLAQMMADAADSDLAAELAAQRSVVATGDGLVDVQI